MSTWSEAFYDRVLRLLTPDELFASSNAVFHDEISLLNGSVDEILAAFAKLEEVRSAVSKLEHGGKSSGRRDANLVAVLENVLLTQKELETRLENIATGITVKSAPEKKKKRRRNDKTDIVKEDIKHLKEALDTPTLTKPQTNLSDGKTNDTELKGVKPIASVAQKRKKVTQQATNSSFIAETKLGTKPISFYVNLVQEVDALPPKERVFRVPEVLHALMKSIKEDHSSRQAFELSGYLKPITAWVKQREGQRQHLELYVGFAKRVGWFVKSLPASEHELGTVRLLNKLFAALRELRN